MNWMKKLLPLGVALMALGTRADVDALVRSAAVSIDLDTRLTARTVASAADILPISCSLVNAGASSGIAQLSVEGPQNAVLTLSTGLLFSWVPTEPGVYTLKHQIVGASTPALTATFIVPSRSAAVTLDLDTHTGVRQIAQGDAASVLPFAYSGSNWGDECGTATVTGKRDGVALSTQIGPSDKTSVYDWGFYSEPGRYVFTHASTAPGATDLTAEFEVVPHPDNDYFFEATDLGRTTSGTATGDSTWATLENGEPITAMFSRAVKTVWWKWTSPGAGSVTLNTFGSDFDTVLAVYRGAALNALTRVASNDDAYGERQSEVEFAVAADTTYYVCVGGYGGSSDGEAGIVRLAWSSTMMPNDFYSGAERLPSSLAGQATGDNFAATPEYDDPIRKTYSMASNTVWWAWTAPGWGVMRFDTAGSAFDTVLGVYTNKYDYGAHVVDAGSIRYLRKVAENDDYNQTRQSQVEFACTAGMTYYVCVSGYNAATAKGAITLNWIPSDGMDPGNDDFADAFEISGTSGTGYGNNEYATSETGENSSYPYSERSVWWAWMAERTGRVEFSTKGSDFDTVLEAYTGYAVNALTRIAANDDEDPSDYVNTSRIEFDCTCGKTYYLRVAGYGSPDRGAIQLDWSYLSIAPAPANDRRVGATVLTGRKGTATGNNENATVTNDELGYYQGTDVRNVVWWTWTAPADGTMHLTQKTSRFSPVTCAYRKAANGTIEEVGVYCERTVPYDVIFACAEGVQYYVTVGGLGWRAGDIEFTWKFGAEVPPNDELANAIDLGWFWSGVVGGNNFGATLDHTGSSSSGSYPNEPITFVDSGGVAEARYTVWWKWHAAGTGNVTFSTAGSGFDTVLGVFEWNGSRFTAGLANDDAAAGNVTSEVTYPVEWGSTYYVCVAGKFLRGPTPDVPGVEELGKIALSWSVDFPAAANDNFAHAAEISGASGTVAGDTTNATSENGEPASVRDLSLWFKWRSPTTGTATFTTSESGELDPYLSVFTGDSLATLTEVASDDDSAGGLNARCTFDCTAGETYIICVSSGEYEFDTFKLGWTTSGETLGGYAQWAMEKGLTGANAAWDAVSGKWGDWPNAFIYTFGDGLLWGTRILGIDIRDGEPVITTAPVEEGHTDFDMKVIGTPNLQNWSSPVMLENKSGDDWTLPVGAAANFFRVRLSE